MFVPNPKLAEQIKAQPEYAAAMRRLAAPAASAAEAFARTAGAPWMARRGAKDLIVVDVTEDGARITNTDHAAHLQEFGSRNNAPHAPLRRGARAAGLKLTEQ